MKACPVYVDRTRTHAAAEQQPEGWRFVLDTILPGYQWAPQWVLARTPTVHWGPISGKAVGGPNTVHHSSTVQETPQTLFVFLLSRISVFFWSGVVLWHLWIGRARHPGPGSVPFLVVVLNVGGWLAHCDFALDVGVDFLAVVEHRLFPFLLGFVVSGLGFDVRRWRPFGRLR